MLLWSYFRVVFKDPGSVPENWRAVVSDENLEAGCSMNDGSDYMGTGVSGATQSNSDVLDRRANVGYCNHCQNVKPLRCHHCSVCEPSSFILINYSC